MAYDEKNLTIIAAYLEADHGANPQEIGSDGHEDDFGDLLLDAAAELVGEDFDWQDPRWERFEAAASASTATDMRTFVRELQEAIR